MENLLRHRLLAADAALWTIPPPTRHYQDRPHIIAAIDAALTAPQSATALTALHGFGGVGKTQLASAYAAQRRDRYAAAGVWLNAETEASLIAGLAVLAEPLRLDARHPDQLELARHASERLGHRSPPALSFSTTRPRRTLCALG